MTPTAVSVVIPAFNAESLLPRTLESVLSQSPGGHDMEVVVVDDGSADGTAAIVAKAARDPRAPVRLVSTLRRGVSAARNEGVRRSTGDYVAFMDHDDLWEPDKIRKQAEILDAEPEAALVFTQAVVERDGLTGEVFPVLKDAEGFLAKAYENLVHWNYIPMSAVMVRRSVLPEPPFDPRYRLAEDWDLWLRVASAAGEKGVRFIAEPLTRYRIVAGRATARMADLRLEDIEIFDEQIRKHPWLAEGDRKRCRRTSYRLREEAGYWLLKEGRSREARRALAAAWRLRPMSVKPLARMVASLVARAEAGETGS